VIGGGSGAEDSQRIVYGRSYEWGFCDAYSDTFDFNRLYTLLISKNHYC
jgi:septin family protein